MTQLDTPNPPGETSHIVSYPRFIWRSLVLATDGSWLFYGWMIVLTAIALVGDPPIVLLSLDVLDRVYFFSAAETSGS